MSARERLNKWHGVGVQEVADLADRWTAPRSFYEVGQRVPWERLDELARDLRSIANAHGFPGEAKKPQQTAFDREVGLRMLQEPIADVGADGVWCYLTTALVPDLVVWRWGWPDATRVESPADLRSRSFDRFLGGHRNALRRVWYRLSMYGDGPGDPPATYWEDALVQVEERPSIGADPRIALLLFEAAKPLMDADRREARFRWLVKTMHELAGWREFRVMPDASVQAVLSDLTETAFTVDIDDGD